VGQFVLLVANTVFCLFFLACSPPVVFIRQQIQQVWGPPGSSVSTLLSGVLFFLFEGFSTYLFAAWCPLVLDVVLSAVGLR